MNYKLTPEKLEEMICCVVDCGMDRDEACDYAKTFCMELICDDAEEVE